MMAQTTVLLEYSAFFSSGLLAQHTPNKKKINSSFSWDIDHHSPSRPSSPISIPVESLMDIDMASYDDTSRSVTPTPRIKTHIQSPQPLLPLKIQALSPKLRKRRSSLTLATSPISTIRSPIRAANNALHLQRQLYTAIGPASPISRSRSGSLAGEDASASRFGSAGVATCETSLGGRWRGGTFACALTSPVPVRRRPTRRLYISALQAPSTPPPTIPLPALPPPHPDQQQQHFRPTNLNTPTRTAHTKVFSNSSASTTSARARGLSVSSSTLDGDEHRIDENVKEI